MFIGPILPGSTVAGAQLASQFVSANRGFPVPRQPTKGFFVDTVTQDRLLFQYNPESIKMQRTPKWAEVEIPGMSHPKLQWINGGNKKFTFSLDFFFGDKGVTSVKKNLDWLESLTYPDFGSDYILERGAHPILFNFGQFYKNVRCAVTGFESNAFYMFDPTSLLPLRAEVNLELTELIFDTKLGVFKSKSVKDIRG
jgi:hypothetical protein